jgi:hypothetical protein
MSQHEYPQTSMLLGDGGGRVKSVEQSVNPPFLDMLVLWGGTLIHRSRVVEEYLSSGMACRIHLEQSPGYASELNPATMIRCLIKDQ